MTTKGKPRDPNAPKPVRRTLRERLEAQLAKAVAKRDKVEQSSAVIRWKLASIEANSVQEMLANLPA